MYVGINVHIDWPICLFYIPSMRNLPTATKDRLMGNSLTRFYSSTWTYYLVSHRVRQLPCGHQTSHLPIELCEMIIDCIAAGVDDSLRTLKTLAACARVCRAWLHRAQYCLSSDFTCRNATLQRWPNVAIRRPFSLRWVNKVVNYV